jgi:hypothetical protein
MNLNSRVTSTIKKRSYLVSSQNFRHTAWPLSQSIFALEYLNCLYELTLDINILTINKSNLNVKLQWLITAD